MQGLMSFGQGLLEGGMVLLVLAPVTMGVLIGVRRVQTWMKRQKS